MSVRSTPTVQGHVLRALVLDTEYRTGEHDVRAAFFEPCLAAAVNYDRAVGYFRSTVFVVFGRAIIEFASRGGQMRFVCSPMLASDDLIALAEGYHQRDILLGNLLEREIETLLAAEASRKPTEILATLIALGSLDIRIAMRSPQQGIYHEKIGLFIDIAGDTVSFKGSSNETWHGWHDDGNLESIEVFCSWRGGIDERRILRHQAYFERLWSNEVSGLEVIPFPEAARRKLCSVARSTMEEAETLLETPNANAATSPARQPQQHQLDAISNWAMAGRRGILQHATGSGKTFTALVALRGHLEEGGVGIILVPSTVLLDQWEAEIREHFPAFRLLAVGGGNDQWRRTGRLEAFTRDDAHIGPRVVLATMQTASRPQFTSRISQGDHVMLVCDEVHQLGSPDNARVMQLETGPRLGLSATPERYGDPLGTKRLLDYFGPIVHPIVTLMDAILAGRLVEYEYFPHAIKLSAEEAERWREQTDVISREIVRGRRDPSGKPILSERARLLLIQRSRIAKKASAKIGLATMILTANYRDGQRWLVYCEDQDQLHLVLSELLSSGLPVAEYYAGMSGDRNATLKWLKDFGGIVVSIRCLDEGVDIPNVTHALILASSQNPRQFIQRRGRVLRRAPDKFMATIHDAIVTPPNIVDEPDQIALARSELGRALEFAEGAINKHAGADLRDVAARIGLQLEDPLSIGVEDLCDNDSLITDDSISEA